MNKSILTTIIIAILGIILVSSIGTSTEKLALSALKFQHKTNVDAFNSMLGYFGIQLAHAEDEGGGSDDSGGGDDGGGDKGNNEGNDNSGDSQKEEQKEESHKQDNSNHKNTVEEHNKIREEKQKENEEKLKNSGLVIGKGDKPTKESLDNYEKEQAAKEDYINDKLSDDQLPKVVPQPNAEKKIFPESHLPKPTEDSSGNIIKTPRNPTHQPQGSGSEDDPDEYCDSSQCYGPGSKDGKDQNCLGKYCKGGSEPFKEGDYCKYNKWDSKKCGSDNCNKWDNSGCYDGKDGKGDCNKWDNSGCGKGDHDHDHHSHGDHNHHHNHKHNYHNDKHYHNHNDNKYYYYYTNDYSNNHATVILQLDYHNSNSHDNIRLEIGNDFDTVINFAGEPDDLVVSNLDLDEGEHFDVCLENLDSDKVNCIKTQIYDEDKAVYVDIRIPE